MEPANKLILDMIVSGNGTARQTVAANTFGTNNTRRAYLVVEKHARDFQAGLVSKQWIAMPGLRGTGKSTLLAQMYGHRFFRQCTKIFVSFDRVKTVDGTFQDFIQACETYLGTTFENHPRPIAMFLDEVQYSENWAVGLKTIFDRTPNIFIYCTGSSALSLQTNPDVARRMDLVKLHPLCFTEYVMIKQASKKQSLTRPINDLAGEIRQAAFFSANAEDAYIKLAALSEKVDTYWKRTRYGRQELFAEYVKHGTLPFTLTLPNETSIWDRISRTLHESLDRDVTAFGKFDQETVNKLPQLLFLLACSVEVSINKLSQKLKIHERTITAMLSALEMTEIITAIPPKGAYKGNIRKASKYLFTSPAMRAALCNFGGIITPETSSTLRGKILEDTVGMYFKRMFLDGSFRRAIVEYDTSEGGADFIVSPDGIKNNSIIVEVGAQKATSKQVIKTMKDVGGKYGMVITAGALNVDPGNNVLRLPFDFFLLI